MTLLSFLYFQNAMQFFESLKNIFLILKIYLHTKIMKFNRNLNIRLLNMMLFILVSKKFTK